MELGFTTRALPMSMPMLAPPQSMPTVYQLAEEEWSLHARCIASGLPPFPTSMCGYTSHRHHFVPAEIGPLFPDQNSSFTLDSNPLQQMTMTMMIPLDHIKMKPPAVPLLPSPSRSCQKRKLPAPFWNGSEIFNPSKIPASKAARMRRKNISDRTTILAALMPWERRISISTMLEEARKYVKFLEAQVMALQYMPVESYFHGTDSPISSGGGNRQQLMQVLVNSRMVQERLYDKGLCVYSVEQMILMRRIVERKMLVQKQQQLQLQPGTGSSTTS